MSKHTPTPWRVEPDETCDEVQGYDIRTDNEEIVGQEGILAGPLGEANAAFIVRAVNAHEALVDALQNARLQIQYLHEKFVPTGSGNIVIASIDAVLVKATAP